MALQDNKAMLYKLLSVVSTVLLLVIIVPNPMIWDTHYKKLTDILPKHTSSTRQIPAARVKIHLHENMQIDLTADARDPGRQKG
jgi:hypothetical protein